MQKILEEMRKKLIPLIQEGGEFSFSSGSFATSVPTKLPDRFPQKLPKQNYRDLAKLIPISWL